MLASCAYSLRFSLRGFRVLVRGRGPEPLRWLQSFMSPYFNTSDREKADWQVGYYCDKAASQQLAETLLGYRHEVIPSRLPNGQPLSHQEFFPPGMRALYNDEFKAFCCAWAEEKRLLLVAPQDGENVRLYLSRAVRKLTTLYHNQQGAVVFHAAAFEKDGRTTLAIAPKGGGKSTFLIRNLLGGARLITNDRALAYRENGKVLVRGLPNIITLHPGTFALFPEFFSRLEKGRYHQVRARGQADGRRRITAAQLCRATDSAFRAEAAITQVVFIDPEIAGERTASQEEALATLREAIFDYAERRRIFFSSLSPVNFDKFRRAADEICELLAAAGPCHYIGWQEAPQVKSRLAAVPGGK